MIKSKLNIVSWSEENKKSCKYNISKNIIHHIHDWIRNFSQVAQFLLTVDIVKNTRMFLILPVLQTF